MSEKDKKQTISSLHSMKTQFLIVVLIVTAIIVTLYTVLIMPRVKDNIRNIYSQYLQDLSISYGRELDMEIQEEGAEVLSNSEKLKETLSEVSLEGQESA